MIDLNSMPATVLLVACKGRHGKVVYRDLRRNLRHWVKGHYAPGGGL